MVKKIKKVKDELLDHNFDGIQELDNELPPWWLMLFYITIIWAVVYLLYYHVLGIGPSSAEEYQQEMARAEKLYGSQQSGGGAAAIPEEELKPLTDKASLDAGKAVFQKNCIPCHGPDGGGGIGPNLTDEYWLHGGHFKDIVHTITVGVPQKGMVPWGPVLKKDEILKVASYVWSLYGTHPANPKAPEGEKFVRETAQQ